MKNNKHTTFRNEKLFCLNCGGEFSMTMPMSIPEMTKKIEAFNKLHKDCPKTWTEPTIDDDKSVKEKAIFWINNCHVGMSSKTMWNCLMGNKDFSINHPYDPDDFSRCYKLLETVPEWKTQLHKLKPLSTAWSNLVDNWEQLTKMFEQNQKEEWKHYEKIGMYEFMQKLIR